MIVATATSGHPVSVPNTHRVREKRRRSARTSLRVQIQAERMLASPVRCCQSNQNEAALAASAVTPIPPEI